MNFYRESRIALQREINKHEELQQLIMQGNFKEWEDILAVTGVYLGIVLDGYYDPEDLETMLFNKLQERRTIYVVQ